MATNNNNSDNTNTNSPTTSSQELVANGSVRMESRSNSPNFWVKQAPQPFKMAEFEQVARDYVGSRDYIWHSGGFEVDDHRRHFKYEALEHWYKELMRTGSKVLKLAALAAELRESEVGPDDIDLAFKMHRLGREEFEGLLNNKRPRYGK